MSDDRKQIAESALRAQRSAAVTEVEFLWRGEFANNEVNELHADAFEHDNFDDDWNDLVARHSLGWVVARSDGSLVGFVNILWDGLVHAWIQDLVVASSSRRQRIGVSLIEVATKATKAAGCEWLHVDFDGHLKPFYFGAAGFEPTNAGLINLTQED